MALPKVSIITVCFNNARTIEKTITSVLTQSYSNLEYIIVDGGSTDGTVEIIQKYSDGISWWCSEEDKGISDAFNKGIQKAEGSIIGIINADDWYETNAVEQSVKTLEDNPEAEFSFGDQQYVNQQGEYLFLQKGDPNYIKCIFYEMPSIPHPTVFVKRKIYEQYGFFNTAYKTAMDYEFLLRISTHGITGAYTPTRIAYMRLGGTSDYNYRQGYKEVMLASIEYGYGKKRAKARYIYKNFKTMMRKKLEKWEFDEIVRTFRHYVGKRYRY